MMPQSVQVIESFGNCTGQSIKCHFSIVQPTTDKADHFFILSRRRVAPLDFSGTSGPISADLGAVVGETSSNMVNLRDRVTPLLATTAIILFSARGVEAHGHHAENIPEGKYISEEPIVRRRM
jgi:hypothetical protein